MKICLLRIVLLFVSGFVIVIILVFPSLEKSMMWPGAEPLEPAKEGWIEKRWLDMDEGPVEMWFIPASGLEISPKPTVICAHGNAECIDWAYQVMKPYLDMGVNLALCEYRGYGRSKGTPSQEHITHDFINCYDWIVQKQEVDSARIFFQGSSIGTGVVCALAQKRNPKALILISPMINTRTLAKDKFPALYPVFRVFFQFKSPFRNDAFLKINTSPVLILHGKQDKVIPFSHGQHLHNIAWNSRLIELPCGHNDILSHSDEFWPSVRKFLLDHRIIQLHETISGFISYESWFH
ncbi:alpha/beta hydrolase [bacterium]|nr:alpha/beta hydrolase [bacterium]